MVTIQSQNFGVEIEMTGVSRGTAASVIANYFGVGGIHFAGGTYQTYEAKDSKGRVWKCMRDGSITPRRRRGGAIVEADDTYRCEVVTPILQYEDITDLQEVIRALVKKGAMANSSCGIFLVSPRAFRYFSTVSFHAAHCETKLFSQKLRIPFS